MPEPSTFSISRLNNNIYPLSYSYTRKYDIDVLYLTVASVEDVYGLMRDRLGAYLYIFGVGHDMVKDGLYLTLKEILEKIRLEADFIYEDEIIAIKKEKVKKFLVFPQHDLKMCDHDKLINENGFTAFFEPAKKRRKDGGVFLDINDRPSKLYIDCHDNSLMYCETRDMGLKFELLKKMLHDYFEAYLVKNLKKNTEISVVPQELAEGMLDKWKGLEIREENTVLKGDSITAAFFESVTGGKTEAGKLVYRMDKKEWTIEMP